MFHFYLLLIYIPLKPEVTLSTCFNIDYMDDQLHVFFFCRILLLAFAQISTAAEVKTWISDFIQQFRSYVFRCLKFNIGPSNLFY